MPLTEETQRIACHHVCDDLWNRVWDVHSTDFLFDKGVFFIAAEKDGVRIIFYITARLESEPRVTKDIGIRLHELMHPANQTPYETYFPAFVPVDDSGKLTDDGRREMDKAIRGAEYRVAEHRAAKRDRT